MLTVLAKFGRHLMNKFGKKINRRGNIYGVGIDTAESK